MNRLLRYPHTPPILLALLGGVFFFPYLGAVHLFDWDEINFAEIAREMIVLGDYLRVYIDYQPFWEKPPLFIWMQAGSMHLWGVGEYAARFPNAVCGVVSLLLLYRMGTRLHDRSFGLLWAGAYVGSVLPHLYFRSGIIDPWFNLFIFLGLYGLMVFVWRRQGQAAARYPLHPLAYLLGGGLVLGLAILTKGPVAYLLVALTLFVYWLTVRLRLFVPVWAVVLYTLLALVVTLTWFGVETARNGPWFMGEFIRYQYRLFSTPDAGHKGFPGYHLVVLLVGCFPVSVFALRGLSRTGENDPVHRDVKHWMLILLGVVVVLFSVVQSKIVHYSSLAYFPLSYLGALAAYRVRAGSIARPGWWVPLLAGIGGLFAVACVALPWVGMHPGWIRPWFAADPFAQANLDAAVVWRAWDMLPGLWLPGVLIAGLAALRRGAIARAWGLLFGGTAVFVWLALAFYVGRIEAYSQRAAIEFFEARQGEDCYVATAGYKSYAQLFYTRKQPPAGVDLYGTVDLTQRTERPTGLASVDYWLAPPVPYFRPEASRDLYWLLHGPVDKPVYIVCKLPRAADLLAGTPGLYELYRKNGFVFMRREALTAPEAGE
ncbi:MAG: phospholipid carrier-dependent glycosyltransferase [Bacteroidia bacterium]